MSPYDLVSLSAVKAWGGGTPTSANDDQVQGLITAISRAIYARMQRASILPALYTESYDGNDGSRILLRQFPAISVSSVTMGITGIAAAPSVEGYGFALEAVDPTPPGRQASLLFRRGRFYRGMQNVSVAYVAGYQVSAEAQTVPSTHVVTALQPFGSWASDRGVTYANGAALTAVASNPLQGQYTVAAGAYTFNTADANAAMLLNYGYVPADLAQACIEWAASRLKAQSYIGVRTKSLGGQETMSYDTGPLPDFVKSAIQPYMRVTMC